MSAFEAGTFVEKQVNEIRTLLGYEQALIACSGGVDSTTCAVLTHRAIGKRLVCVFIDTGFMRLGEPDRVVKTLGAEPLNLPIRLVDMRARFLKALAGLGDAEEKRKAFRGMFYDVFKEIAIKERCRFLVQGTIAPDWIETKGGIKTQHNVLEQIGISAKERYGFSLIEPLAYLYKDQVREVARYLKVPPEISERQPFPGPGLSVRVVGAVTEKKLETLKKASQIVEEELERLGPQQYFAVVLDDEDEEFDKVDRLVAVASGGLKVSKRGLKIRVLKGRATGVKGDVRAYGMVCAVTALTAEGSLYKPSLNVLTSTQVELVSGVSGFTRVVYRISDEERKGKFLVVARAIRTRDFMTADPANINWDALSRVSKRVMDECPDVSSVYYDVTSKPPATIEFE